MAKNRSSVPTPEVSSLPLKSDESPLVIDLPDGQKLVVGKLANGSVIEVATWRGTGRPDSRTSRLMLGMSSASEVKETDGETSNEKKPKEKTSVLSSLVTRLSHSYLAIVATWRKSRENRKTKSSGAAKSSEPLIEKVTPVVEEKSDDVQDWLDSILAKSEPRTDARGDRGTRDSSIGSTKRIAVKSVKKNGKKASSKGDSKSRPQSRTKIKARRSRP